MEGQVFIRREKILLRDSLTRAFLPVCTTLSTVFVDKGSAPSTCSASAMGAVAVAFFHTRAAHLLEIISPCRIDHRSCPHHRAVHHPPQGKNRSKRSAGKGARGVQETGRE